MVTDALILIMAAHVGWAVVVRGDGALMVVGVSRR